MMLNSEAPMSVSNDPSSKCLHRIKQTLEMRHICPTTPDTLRIYPFKDVDPFIINPAQQTLDLENINSGEDTASFI